MSMKKYTHAKCIRDVIENDVVLFRAEQTYKIVEFDFKSLLYYIEVDNVGEELEVAVTGNHPDFIFIEEEDQHHC